MVVRAELTAYPEMSWQQFHDEYFTWKQGEHVMVCAPTGWGKTTLIARILDLRQYVIVLATKFKDETYTDFTKNGYTRIAKWPPPRNRSRIIVWPKAKHPTIAENVAIQKDIVRDALNRIFIQGQWTTVIDETSYVSNEMGLSNELKTFQHQGRSSGLTNVLGFQRPSHIPLIVYDSASHVFAARSALADDAKRLASLGGLSRDRIAYTLSTLPKYSYLYLPTREPDKSPVIVNTAH